MQFDANALRPGQRQALEMIRQRVQRGEKTTAIVLPCRYGKSDVARLASLGLRDEGLICTTLALSPNTVLRKQIADVDKWDTAMLRYKVKVGEDLKISQPDRMKLPLTPNDESFVSITTQLAVSQMNTFTSWIEYKVRRFGLPVLVVVDECHTGSESNEWGKIVPCWTAAGAHVVLLTATAERTDGKRIPGFAFDSEVVTDVVVSRCVAGSEPHLVRVEIMAGVKERLRLVPDVEVSFGEAWDGGALCKVTRTPFDVDLRTVRGVHEKHVMLSELAPSRAKELLGQVVRDGKVIDEGCDRLVKSLRVRRGFQLDAKAIVYCANDRSDQSTNAHARKIKESILRVDPSLVVLIATSAEDDGEATIQSFIDGRGDVLIVKQMAGIGLDVGPLKIGLDLSPTRTYASFVQRMMRPATPHLGVMVMEWISPDDVVSAALFEKLVKANGGEATTTDLQLIRWYEKPRKSDEDYEDDETLFTEGTLPGNFDDSAGSSATADQWSSTMRFIDAFPELLRSMSHAEVAARVEASGLDLVDPPVPEVNVRDTFTEANAIRTDLNALAKEITQRRLSCWGLDYSQYSREITQVWIEAKAGANWPYNTELSECDDLTALERMRTWLESEVVSLSARNSDA